MEQKTLVIPEKRVAVNETVDVIVAGGGPAGLGAAVSAARTGSSVLLLEKRGFLGGNITAAFVETCNWFLHGARFSPRGLYREIETAYRKEYGRSHDVRENAPHRFSSEYLKIFLDEFILRENIRILLHSFVNDVVVNNNHLDGVIIQTKNGPMAVSGSIIIDATGDGDIAAAAGSPYWKGRDRDGYCQPGTLNFRIAGVNVKTLTEQGDLLKKIGKQFEQDYLAGSTNLTCKRKDLPFGRLTQGGLISYINYPCEYMIDPTGPAGLTQGEIACRGYIKEMYHYMKEHFPGFENIEIAAIAPEIGFRDSRRIQGKYTLTHEDIETNKTFEDTVCLLPRMYDMLSPDGNMQGDGALEGKGYNGHIFVHIEEEDTRTFEVPYRCLLPVTIDNLLVAGRCISTTHVAESGIRAVYACMLTGQAAGTAASCAVRKACIPEQVAIGDVQASLNKQGVL
jgi:hypothetical protein